MNQDDLHSEIKRLADRLARIEQALNLDPLDEQATPPVAPEPETSDEALRPPVVIISPFTHETDSPLIEPDGPGQAPGSEAAPPPLPGTPERSLGGDPQAKPTLARHLVTLSRSQHPAAQQESGPSPAEPPGEAQQADPAARDAIELMIGGRWAAWAGAIAVVVAVGFFVKLAVDEGWFGRLSPLTKCLLSAGLGGLLILAGEWTLRKIGKVASVGLFGAGLGTLYLTAFASFRYFNLVSESGAFLLLALTALFGFALTVRTRMLTIGVLSVVGGYLAPLLLSGAATFVAALPIYLTMLLGIALALAARRPRPFRAMRYVAFGGHVVVGTLWAINEGREHVPVALPFLSLWWLMITGQAVLAARRDESAQGNVILSLLSTLWFVAIGCAVLANVGPNARAWSGLFTLLTAVVAGAIAYQIGHGLRCLRGRPRDAVEQLAIALWGQFGVLLAVAVAMRFEGYGQTIGWLAIALAAIEIGRRIPSGRVTIFGLLVGLPGLVRIVTADYESRVLQVLVTSIGQVDITRWTLLALVAIAFVHVAARRVWLRRHGNPPVLPWILSGLSVAGWVGLCVLQCRGVTVTGGWLLAAVALLAAERFGRRQKYIETAAIMLTLAAGRWLVFDAALRRLDPGWDAGSAWPLLNGQMVIAVALAVVGWWLARILRRREVDGRVDRRDAPPALPGWQVIVLASVVLLLTSFSFEIDRTIESIAARGDVPWLPDHVRHLLLTLLWAGGGLAVGVLIRLFNPPAAEGGRPPKLLIRFAWSILLVCAVKWIVFDSLLLVLSDAQRVPRTVLHAWPLINLQLLVGGGVIAALLLLYRISGLSEAVRDVPVAERSPLQRLAAWLPCAGAIMLLWGLTFEVERAIGRWEPGRDGPSAWSGLQVRMLWWTLLWSAGGVAMLTWGRWRNQSSLLHGGWAVLLGAGVIWLLGDTVADRVVSGVTLVSPVLNLQFLIGAALIVLLVAAERITRGGDVLVEDRGQRLSRLCAVGWVQVAAIGLWLGSFELDRWFSPEAGRFENAAMARHTAFSIYWGLYAIVLVAIGFIWRSAWCRYGGLALLAITLGKVLLIDLAEIQYVYRVLSLLGVGLLLVGTSVAYGKLAPRLLGQASEKVNE